MWTIDRDALERLEIGAGILGTGGGGNPYIGKLNTRLLLEEGRTITMVSPDDVPDDALVTSVGQMGAPVVSVERIRRGDECLVALRALEKHIGKSFTHVVPGEIGGSNSMVPLIVSALTGLPTIDGDGMGRAFPELQMDTFSIYGIPATPATIADVRHHVTLFDGFEESTTLERYARVVTVQMGGSAGYAFPVMTGTQLRRTIIPGTYTLAIAVGEAVLHARRVKETSPVDAVLQVTGGERLFSGKIVDVERRLIGGFARGVVQLDGVGAHEGEKLRIDFQNENLIARDNTGKILAVVPDLICMVDEDTAEPITTEVLRYGLRIAVIGIPAPVELKTPIALESVGPAAFGYHDVPYIPMAGVFGQGLWGGKRPYTSGVPL